MYVPQKRIPETAYYAFSPSEKQILPFALNASGEYGLVLATG